MQCAVSWRHVCLVLALSRLANHTSSPGMAANASPHIYTGARCRDITNVWVFFSLIRMPSTVLCDSCDTPLSHGATHRPTVWTDDHNFRALCAWHRLCSENALSSV